MQMLQKITPCLWFDKQAEEAANFYIGVFKNSRIGAITHYGEAGPMPKGTLLTVSFELDGQPFLALNGGPNFKFTEAVSFQIPCRTQADVDHYWNRLCEGGKESQCGWLKDKYGLSWQVVPTMLPELIASGDPEKVEPMMQAMFKMKKLDIVTLQRAYDG